jgi:hypothetical protein
MTPPTSGIAEEQRLEQRRFIELAITGKRHQRPASVHELRPDPRSSGVAERQVILTAHDVTARYRLQSEEAVEGTGEWEVQWRVIPPANGPPVVRRLSRQRFQALDATGHLDSSYVFTADSLASFLSEPMPLHDDGIRS